MADTRTTIANMLKYVYLPRMVDQFYKRHFFFNMLKKSAQGGLGDVVPVFPYRVHGHGSRAESGTLPTAGSLAPEQIIIGPKYHYAQYSISGPAMAASRSGKFSAVQGLTAGLRMVAEGFADDLERQALGNGSGVLTLCGTTSSANTVVLDGSTKGGGFGTQFLQPNMLVDVKVTNGGADATNGGDITIDSLTPATPSFAFTGTAISTSSANAVYVADNRDTSGIREMMGLAGIATNVDPGDQITNCGAGYLQAHAVATYDWWKAAIKTNSGTLRDISFELLHEFLTECERVSGTSDQIDFLLSYPAVRNQYGLLLTPDRRYAGDPDTFEGGFKYLTFNGIKWYQSFYCWPNRVFAVNMDHLFLKEESDPHWDENSGSILLPSSTADEYTARLVYYANIGTDKRCAFGVLEDINH